MSDPIPPDVPDLVLPPSLRLLKGLVIALTLTMIAGVITVVGLLVTRMPQAMTASAPALPDQLTLPQGTEAQAVTFGKGWMAVVTTDNHILIFGSDGTQLQDLAITPPG